MMTLEPTQAQRIQIQKINPGKLALAQFFAIRFPNIGENTKFC